MSEYAAEHGSMLCTSFSVIIIVIAADRRVHMHTYTRAQSVFAKAAVACWRARNGDTRACRVVDDVGGVGVGPQCSRARGHARV